MKFKVTDEPKSVIVTVRVSPRDKAALVAEAKVRMLTISDFVLRRALGRPTPVRHDIDAIVEMGHLASELKAFVRSDPGADRKRVHDLIEQLSATMSSVYETGGRK